MHWIKQKIQKNEDTFAYFGICPILKYFEFVRDKDKVDKNLLKLSNKVQGKDIGSDFKLGSNVSLSRIKIDSVKAN